MKIIKRLGFLGLFLFNCFHMFAQGPAGIGTSSSNLFWYKADAITGASNGDGITTWQDQSGNAVHASITRQAIEFPSGNTSSYTTTNNYSSITNSFTMEGWVKPVGTHEIDPQVMYVGFDYSTVGTSGQKYLNYPAHGLNTWGSGGHAGVGISVGTNGVSVYEHTQFYMPAVLVWDASSYSDPNVLNTWAHIAVVYENKVPKLYVNGIYVATGLTSAANYVHPSIELGGGSWGHYEGSVDEFRIWDGVRTASEILAFKDHQILGQATNLIGNWKFDEGSISTLMDASGYIGNISKTGSGSVYNAVPPSSIVYSNPVYYSSANTINGKPVIGFDGEGTRLELPSKSEINSGGPYNSRAFNIVFKTNSTDVSTTQVLYEEGNDILGLNIYISGGKIFLNGWNHGTADATANIPWGPVFSSTCSTAVQTNSDYILTFVYDYNRNAIDGFLNGTSIGSLTNIGKLSAHLAGNIGCVRDGTIFHDASVFSAPGYVFKGYMAELASYTLLNSAERKITENYLSLKYNIQLTDNDYYSFESTHNYRWSGVGSDNAQNTSLSGTTEFLSISASTLADGYFALFADDNQSIDAVDYLTGFLSTPTVNAPKNVCRMLRTWRIDATQASGVLNFKIPQTLLKSYDDSYQKPVLILDNDGDFKTGSRIIALNSIGSDFTIDDVQVLDGDFVGFGILQQYDYTSYASNLDALGKSDVNYDDVFLSSAGFSVRTLTPLQAGNYLLMANDNGAVSMADNNTPKTDILRADRLWKVNQYGSVGITELSIDPSIYPLPSGKDTYVILIDRDHDGNFSNADMIGCVKEGAQYKANYISLNDGDLLTVAAATGVNNELSPKVLARNFNEGTDHDFTNGSTVQLQLQPERNFEYATSCTETLKKATLNLLLNTGGDYVFGNNAFTTRVGVEVKGYADFSATDPAVVTYNMTLNLDQSAPEMLHFINITKDYANVKVYKIHITSFTAPPNTLIQNSLVMSAQIIEERQVITPLTSASIILNTAYTLSPGNKIYNFTWTTDRCNAPSYQFQLLRLYNKEDELLPGSINTNEEWNITAEIDWNKALTLETTHEELALTITEGTGIYLWRVRPIGNLFPGGVADSRNWGSWSSDDFSLPSPITLNCCVETYQNTLFYYDQFDRDKNFIYSRSFTEDAKIHEGMTYANGLMQVKQTQASIPSNTGDGKIIASQTLYDYSGRSSLQSLQAPLQDGTIELGYRNNLVKKDASTLYGPQHFDADSKLYAPDAVDATDGGLINQYYSDLNPDIADLNVPNAENYPLSRTVYDNEGTGMVIEQGGPGLVHKIGAGHTVRMQHGSVSDDELIYVFGDEAPKASTVYKTITTDQNNITSVAYIDQTGKTLATCLSKNDLTSNLTPLPSETGAGFTVREILKETVPFGKHGNMASKDLNFGEATEVTISYEITPSIVQSFCGSYCATCGYLLKIKVLDLANPANNKIIQSTIAPGTVVEGTCPPASVTPIDLDASASGNTLVITLPAGKYKVEKIIELDQSAAQTYASNIVDKIDLSLKPTTDAITAFLDASDIQGLNVFLFGLQTAPPSGFNIEVYGEDGAVLYSQIDEIGTNDAPLTTMLEGYQVRLVTTCCSITLPIIFPEFNPCDYASSGYSNSTLGNYFDLAYFNKTGKHINEISSYSTTEFTQLITDMLNEPAGWYDCEMLWNCWKNAIYTDGRIGNTTDNGDDGAVSNPNIGGETKNQPGYNDQPDWVKQAADGLDGVPSTTNIMDQFFDCAGRHYTGFSTDESLLKAKPYKYFRYDHPNKTNGQKLCEDAFCNYAGPLGEGPVVPAYSTCNFTGDLCLKTYTQLYDNTYTSDIYYTLTVGGPSPLPVHELTSQDYSSFYQCIKSSNLIGGMANVEPVVMTDTDLEALKEEKETLCSNECESKYNLFLDDLTLKNSAPYVGMQLQANGQFDLSAASGGWVDINNDPVTINTTEKNLYLNAQPSGRAISSVVLTVGTTYNLKYTVVPGASTVNVYNGSTLIESHTGGHGEMANFQFKATATTLIFEGILVSGNNSTLDNVSIKPMMPALNLPYEDLCCTARELVDYCKQSCTLTIVKNDCDPPGPGAEDILVGLGTQEEIERFTDIMYGDFDLQIKPEGGSCAPGYEETQLYLSSFYNFTGNANDGSGNNLDGTVNGATLATDKAGNTNKAYAFDGASNYISTVADSYRSITNKVTIAAWVQTNSSANQVVVSTMNAYQDKGYQLVVNGGYASFEGRDGSGAVHGSGNSTTLIQNASTWYYLTGVYNNGIWQIWVNGVKENEAYHLPVTNVASTDPLIIGKNYEGSNLFFSGKIDEVSTFSSALTNYQLQNLWTAANTFPFINYTTTPIACTNLIPYTKWEETLSSHNNPQILSSGDNGSISLNGGNITKLDGSGNVVFNVNLGLNQRIFKMVNANDGGFILVGYTSNTISGSTNQGGNDAYIVKINADGTFAWQKTYGWSGNDVAYNLFETSDHKLIVTGNATDNSYIFKPYVIVLNSDGSLIWQRVYDFPYGLFKFSNETSDGEYLLAGSCGATAGTDDLNVLKVDHLTGDIISTYQNSGIGQLHSLKRNSDGSFILGGGSSSPIHPVYLLKLNSDISFNKLKTFPGKVVSGIASILNIQQLNDGGYLFGSEIDYTFLPPGHGGQDIGVVRTNANLDVVWETPLGGNQWEDMCDVKVTSDGGCIVMGGSSSTDIPGTTPHGGADVFISKLNSNGAIEWQKLYGGNSEEANVFVNSDFSMEQGRIFQTSEGEYVFTIATGSSASGDVSGTYGTWVLKIGIGTNQTCNPHRMCIKWLSPAEIVIEVDPEDDPTPLTLDQETILSLKNTLESQLAKCNSTNQDRLEAEYNTQCAANINDKCEVDYTLKHHHYTLYYFDRANNLVKTVPPKGVVHLDLDATGVRDRMVHPSHTLITFYQYNSLGQLVQQITPDGGTTNFIYNTLGQLRFSQNAKQAAASPAQFSYTKYDYLNRIIEVGKATFPNGGYTNFAALTTAANSGSFQDLGLTSYPVNSTSEQTNTVYTAEATNVNYLGTGQRFLQNRVSYSYTRSLRGEKSVSYFSYDPHGNVDWMVQELPGFSQNHIAYEYDLISNKVLKVKFNENKPDQFFHKYDYDADNRITAAFTSKNGLIWDKDAAYNYYKHGTLKRTEIGEDKIQGMDYAYTIQGWLKGINTPAYDKTLDPGSDGINNNFLKDEYGMTLGYFNGDFKRTGSPYTYGTSSNYQLQNSAKELFNGNIFSWSSRVEQEYKDYLEANASITAPTGNEQFTTANLYTYDHLNRILASDLSKYNGTGGTDFTAGTDYHTDYSYDPNGNILTLNRKGFGTNQDMDNLTYNYTNGTINNQLSSITDPVSYDNYIADIDNQEEDNYTYDQIGNMILDASEGVTILWNVYGKIDAIKPINFGALGANGCPPGCLGPNMNDCGPCYDPSIFPDVNTKPYIAYTYDAMGNRIKKEVNIAPFPYVSGQPTRIPDKLTTTYYVRDASGNVMAIYERTNFPLAGQSGYYTAEFRLKELPLYGSSRLGEFTPNTLVASKIFSLADMDKITFENQVLTKVTENTVLTTTGVKTDVLTDNSSQQVNVPAVCIQQLAYNSTGDNYSVTPEASFLGTMKKNIALAEDQNGQLKFYAVTAANYWGAQNICLVYDATGKLMQNSSGINADPAGKAVILRKPGSDVQYYLFTKGMDGQVRYSIVDMSLGANGDVVSTSKNIVLDKDAHTNYGTVMLGLEDDVKKESILYATRYTAPTGSNTYGTLDMVVFTITTSSDIVQSPELMSTVNTLNASGFSEMQISPDTRKLLLYNHKSKTGWFNHQESEIIIFNLGVDYKTFDNPVTCIKDPVVIPGYSKACMSADFTGDNRYIYFSKSFLVKLGSSSGTERATYRYDIRDKVITLVNNGYMGDVRRGKDNRMHIDNNSGSSLPAYTEDAESNLTEVTAKAINVTLSGGLLSGALPLQIHRVYCTKILEATYTRLVGLKGYELNDHLGNVTVMIGDRRAAVLGTDVTNNAEIYTYNNYYAFGMTMPGRSSTGGSYRYGFNGKENDNEVKGTGNQQDYGMRIYDPRLGRFLSVDPISKEYPELTPYQFASNSPVVMVDLDGLEGYLPGGYSTEPILTKEDMDKVVNKTIEIYKIIFGGGGTVIYGDEGTTGGGDENLRKRKDGAPVSAISMGGFTAFDYYRKSSIADRKLLKVPGTKGNNPGPQKGHTVHEEAKRVTGGYQNGSETDPKKWDGGRSKMVEKITSQFERIPGEGFHYNSDGKPIGMDMNKVYMQNDKIIKTEVVFVPIENIPNIKSK